MCVLLRVASIRSESIWIFCFAVIRFDEFLINLKVRNEKKRKTREKTPKRRKKSARAPTQQQKQTPALQIESKASVA